MVGYEIFYRYTNALWKASNKISYMIIFLQEVPLIW